MFIGADEIKEVVDQRPYEGLPDSALNQLLGAFEEFLPEIESYSSTTDELMDSYPEALTGALPAALTLTAVIDPTVSRAIFELLLELQARDLSDGVDPKERYREWTERGLLYGFDSASLQWAAHLLSQDRGTDSDGPHE